MSLLAGFLPETQAYLCVLARLFCFFQVAPGFSSENVPGRIRLLLAVATSVMIAPFCKAPDASLIHVVLESCLNGLFLGTLLRLFFDLFLIVGTGIGHQVSLTGNVSAMFEGANDVFSAFFQVYFLALFFAGDFHLPFFQMLIDSHVLVPPTSFVDGNFLEVVLGTLKMALQASFSFWAPFLIFGLLYALILGLLNRFIPTLPIFFVIRPLDLLIIFGILWLCLPHITHGFQKVLGQFWEMFF